MNSTKVSSADNRYSVKPFFGFTLKNNWQHFALYLIIMLLVIVLPCVMVTNEELQYRNTITNWNNILENVTLSTGICGVIASLAVAGFSGMSAASYVNSKQQVGCWHSFPLRREGLFFVETSVRAIYYLAAYLPCAIAAWIFINISLPMTAYFNIVYLKHILAAILCYLLLYSVILFAGGLTGTAPVRLIMTALILGLPIALYGLLLICASIGIPQLSENYYLSETVLRVLCMPYRIGEAVGRIDSSTYPEHFAYIFTAIPEIAVYYGGALLLHKYRKSELSGTTIIWKPVFIITKYITIFTAALLGIALFGSGSFFGTARNPIWTIFGLVFGLVVSSMVVNAILYRSSKAIFKGLRGLAAVSAAAVVVMLILPLDVFDLDSKVYDVSNTKSITIDGVEFGKDTDDLYLETLIALLRNEKISNKETTPSDYSENRSVYFWNDTGSREKLIEDFRMTIYSSQAEAEDGWKNEENNLRESYDFHYSSGSYVQIIQKPKFGIPLAKRIYIDMSGEFWDTLARSAEYSAYQNEITQIQAGELHGVSIQFAGFSEYVDFYSYSDVVVRESAVATVAVPSTSSSGSSYERLAIRDLLMEILPYCSYSPANRDNGVIVGNLDINTVNLNRTIPIYADNPEVLNGVCRMLNIIYENDKTYEPYPEFTDADDYFDYCVDNYLKSIAIIDSETGEIREMPMKQFRELASSMTFMRERGYSNVDEHLRVYDSRYWIVASFENPFANSKDEYHNTRTLYIREGAVTDEELTEIFNLCK